jgi:hypothetical protein
MHSCTMAKDRHVLSDAIQITQAKLRSQVTAESRLKGHGDLFAIVSSSEL